jgi:hypothetical protein
MLCCIGFHAWCLIVKKYDFVCVKDIVWIAKKWNYMLLKNNLTKIGAIPRLRSEKKRNEKYLKQCRLLFILFFLHPSLICTCTYASIIFSIYSARFLII